MLNDFKTFLLRGNVVDLAIAVVIGAAFKSIIDAFVADFVTPLIAAIGGQPDFGALNFTINGSTFRYGDFLNQVISFVIIAAVIFFFVVVPINKLMERRKTETANAPLVRECPFCLSSIPKAAHRCAFCTQEVATAA